MYSLLYSHIVDEAPTRRSCVPLCLCAVRQWRPTGRRDTVQRQEAETETHVRDIQPGVLILWGVISCIMSCVGIPTDYVYMSNVALQKALRVHLHDRVSPPLLPDPVLCVPPERHPDACVRAVSHGPLHPRHSWNRGHGESSHTLTLRPDARVRKSVPPSCHVCAWRTGHRINRR